MLILRFIARYLIFGKFGNQTNHKIPHVNFWNVHTCFLSTFVNYPVSFLRIWVDFRINFCTWNSMWFTFLWDDRIKACESWTSLRLSQILWYCNPIISRERELHVEREICATDGEDYIILTGIWLSGRLDLLMGTKHVSKYINYGYAGKLPDFLNDY